MTTAGGGNERRCPMRVPGGSGPGPATRRFVGAVLLVVLCCARPAHGSEPSTSGETPETSLQAVTLPDRDPFLPGNGGYMGLAPPSVDPGQLDLQAILFDPGRSKALISGQIVSEGDRVFDYTVSKIQPGKVSLRRGENHYYLFLVLSYEKR